jgi:beta-barrel assembly-enhancing protease
VRFAGLVAVALLCIAAAPAPDRAEALRSLVALDLRVASIGTRLAVANVAECARRASQAGIVLHDLAQFSGADRVAAAKTFGLGTYPAISAVIPGSVADQAGLRAGDAIMALDGQPIGVSDPKTPYARIAKIEAAIESGPTILIVDRPDHPRPFMLAGKPGCASRVQVVPGRKLNAHADGTYVQLTSAVAEYAADDNELAAIIAHEMAHNILGHRERLNREGRRAATIRATEIEADRMSVLLLKNAGYDPLAAARFWQRFGRKTGVGIFSDGTHQRTKDRVRLLTEEAQRRAQ